MSKSTFFDELVKKSSNSTPLEALELVVFDYELTLTFLQTHNIICEHNQNIRQQPNCTENATNSKYLGNQICVNNIDHNSDPNPLYDPSKYDWFKQKFDTSSKIFKAPHELKRALELFTEAGVKIAIASFNRYYDAIKYSFDLLELPQEVQNNITYVTGYENISDGKTQHLDILKNMFNIPSWQNICLVDDNQCNRDLAELLHVKTIDGTLTDCIGRSLDYLNQEINDPHDELCELGTSTPLNEDPIC